MSTLAALKTLNDTDIRQQVDPDSISPDTVADRLDAIIDEFLNRGLNIIALTAALAGIDGNDGPFAYVQGVGFYKWTASVIAPDALTTFAGSTGTWVYQLAPQVFFNSNTFSDWSVRNISTGTGAWAGVRFYNATGIGAQIGYGSPLNSVGNNLFLFHCVPGSCRIASNSGAVEFAVGGNAAANVKGGFKATSGHFYLAIAAAPVFADNAAATGGGLVIGDVYQTATGELRIVV